MIRCLEEVAKRLSDDLEVKTGERTAHKVVGMQETGSVAAVILLYCRWALEGMIPERCVCV